MENNFKNKIINGDSLKELKKIPKFWKYSVSKVIVPGLEKHERHIISLQNLKNEIT